MATFSSKRNLRSGQAIFGLLAPLGWFSLLPLSPAVARVMGVDAWVTLPLGLMCLLASGATTYAFHAFGESSRGYRRFNQLETLVFTVSPAFVVCLSANPTNFGWAFYLAYLVQCGMTGVTRFNSAVFVLVPVLMTAWFLAAVDVASGLLMAGLGALSTYSYFLLARDATRLKVALREREHLQAELTKLRLHEERDRIARDLHDGIGAELAALFWHVQGLKTEVHDADLAALSERIDMSTAELRNIVWELRATSLAWPALVAHLQTRCQELCGTAGLRCEFVATGPDSAELAGDVRMHLARIVQEGVRNAVRHAQASTVGVSLSWQPDAVTAQVRDDGKGVAEAILAAPRGGLRNLSLRASALGGTLRIENTQPGACLTAVLPTIARAKLQG